MKEKIVLHHVVDLVAVGNYTLQVSKSGYVSARAYIDEPDHFSSYKIFIDPSSLTMRMSLGLRRMLKGEGIMKENE